MFWKSKNSLESKKEFFLKIEKHLSDLAEDNIPQKTITELSEYLTDLLYGYYKDCRKEHPKSKNSYTKLTTDILNNPFYQHRILDFLKENAGPDYIIYSRQILRLNETELTDFIKRKKQFENM